MKPMAFVFYAICNIKSSFIWCNHKDWIWWLNNDDLLLNRHLLLLNQRIITCRFQMKPLARSDKVKVEGGFFMSQSYCFNNDKKEVVFSKYNTPTPCGIGACYMCVCVDFHAQKDYTNQRVFKACICSYFKRLYTHNRKLLKFVCVNCNTLICSQRANNFGWSCFFCTFGNNIEGKTNL